MRACFLGQNVFALGNGFAILQSPPLRDNDNAAASPPREPVAHENIPVREAPSSTITAY